MEKGSTGANGLTFQINLSDFKPGEVRPAIALTAIDANQKIVGTAVSDEKGNLVLSDVLLKSANEIVLGPVVKEGDDIAPEALLRLRREEFLRQANTGVFNLAKSIWGGWFFHIRCVSGSVRKCRRGPWWFDEIYRLATQPFALAKSASDFVGHADVLPVQIDVNRQFTTVNDLLILPFRCETVCHGIVEVYERTCCCKPWFIGDPRIPILIRELEQLVVQSPFPVNPNPPDPDPSREIAFFKEGTLDEKALNAHQDLLALRTFKPEQSVAYLNARPYLTLFSCSCGLPRKVAQGFINPGGTFNICWRELIRIFSINCHEEFSFVVKQVINGQTYTIYNGLTANIWVDGNHPANLVTYSPFARACNDGDEPGQGAFAFLDLIGANTPSFHLKTPNSTGWDRVALPGFNDGLAYPAPSIAAARGLNLNRNWGGTLNLNYKFSADMKTIGAFYYRISLTEADVNGAPVGTRFYLSDGLSWEKIVPVGSGFDIVPETLGPFSAGGNDNLFKIPYNADAEWAAGQFHGKLNTNDIRWSDSAAVAPNPTKRHLVTMEVFDSAGKRLRPTGVPASGQAGVEGNAAFTFRRRFQDVGPTANVPFAALTHLFWWDNRLLAAAIPSLRENGLSSNMECQFLAGLAGSTFGIDYRAYHPNEMFQLAHNISWQRGLGNAAGSTGSLQPSSSLNVGVPPAPPGVSGTNTFAQMLRTDLDPTRRRCAFTVFLGISSKTTDGDNLGNFGISTSAAFALEIS